MYPDLSSMEVMLLMLRGRTTSVPVVDKSNQRLEGIISFWDVFKKLMGEVA
jgi:CBS domain-containing protein